jgi:DNA invertase Pin-like site-specific DNA recombinase
MTKAIIYARFSDRPDADESLSNEKQIERCREYAAQHGYEVLGDPFADEALTGADDQQAADPLVTLSKRPGIVAAIDATQDGMVLLVRWRSRIARDPYIQQAVERIIAGQGGRVEATDESNETGLAGELTRGVLATISKWEVIKIRLMTRLAMQKHQKAGRRMTRKDRCPFGWRADPRDATRLIEDADEQETIRLVVEQRAMGEGLTSICKHLDSLGRKRRGKNWFKGRGTVQAILDRQSASSSAAAAD